MEKPPTPRPLKLQSTISSSLPQMEEQSSLCLLENGSLGASISPAISLFISIRMLLFLVLRSDFPPFFLFFFGKLNDMEDD